ncbi:peptidoglycan D,D-transpeptidase FtsI family protein [Fictibacillus terranigra]|uniref:Penicillin-binding transpeptidase domain-containing protein n=1 Tax=Fictibacillus terranigra TaxID=3058424 RepID=A0ABT8E4H6_9BACL|nr:penicillin-binding transpeptidase domain-containing protein [Fictibacillus sp. CENA-BCM004]MDN4072789.1 penicillin-binding transpeptidase domain-containing protein [Fictibacillus sp. CENA-BCM004]
MNNNQKRIVIAGSLFLAGLLFLAGRLIQIQLVSTESFSKHKINLIDQSVRQRTHSFTINEGRGLLLDRNGEMISAELRPAVILFPFLKGEEGAIDEVANALGKSPSLIRRSLEEHEEPFVISDEKDHITSETMDKINKLKLPGVYAHYIARNKHSEFASALLGVTGQAPEVVKKNYKDKLDKGIVSINTKIGKTGLQQAFDPFLISEGETKLIYHVDRSGSPLFGLDVKYLAPSNPFYPVSVKTTIDSELQHILEDAVDKSGIKNGGAVLLDVSNNELLGMVSRPYHTGLSKNQMVARHAPGSIFKVVTAAAAIENKDLQKGRNFDCDLGIDGKSAKHPLGTLDFTASFSQSCNRTFGMLANEMMETNDKIIDDYAEKLGLTIRSGWHGQVYHYPEFKQFPEEEQGTIWGDRYDRNQPLAVSQTAIGQKNVQVTPLSVANMMAGIARGGKMEEVKAATKILYKNGNTLLSFPNHKQEKGIEPYTAQKLQMLLRGVITDPKGTGRALQKLPYTVAGKSGTAEKGDSNTSNKWFAGYFPADQPKYALVVVDFDYTDANTTVISAYADIVNKIYKNDKEK